ncbi:MAG: SPOR domain-containing protein [Gemmatimonadetes bacterium]|nr:SPOR domain-containing protein [Gemmatimonadota bacterium]
MRNALPEWQPFDFNLGVVPPDVAALMTGGGDGTVVVFAAATGAEADDWAPRAVTTLAAHWGEHAPVCLADAGIANPRLHDVLGEENGEGVVDALVYGASVGRVSTNAAGGSFVFVPAGTPTPDPEGVLRHERWPDLIRELTRPGATLLVYVPLHLPGFEALATRASALVLLARSGEDVSDAAAGLPVTAVLGPPVEAEEATGLEFEGLPAGDIEWGRETEEVREAATPAADDWTTGLDQMKWEAEPVKPVEAQPDTGEWDLAPDFEVEHETQPETYTRRNELRGGPLEAEPAQAGRWDPSPEARTSDEPEPLVVRSTSAEIEEATTAQESDATTAMGATADESPKVSLSPTFKVAVAESRKGRTPPRQTGRPSSISLIGLIVALAAAVWYYGIERAPLPFLDAGAPVDADAEVELPVVPQGRPLPLSLALGAYSTLEEAEAQLAVITAANPSLVRLSAPVVVNGQMFYRVLVGAVPDSAGAQVLGERLVAAGLGGGDALLRDATLAFDLAAFPDRGLADRRVRELADLLIPAYVVTVPQSDGSERYQVYAGGYANEQEASAMRELLRTNGIDVPLAPRRGRPSA